MTDPRTLAARLKEHGIDLQESVERWTPETIDMVRESADTLARVTHRGLPDDAMNPSSNDEILRLMSERDAAQTIAKRLQAELIEEIQKVSRRDALLAQIDQGLQRAREIAKDRRIDLAEVLELIGKSIETSENTAKVEAR